MLIKKTATNFLKENNIKIILFSFLCIYVLSHIFFYKIGILKSFNTDYKEQITLLLNGNFSFINSEGELVNKTPFLFPVILAFQLKLASILGVKEVLITSLFSIAFIFASGYLLFKITRLLFKENYKYAQLTLIIYLSIPFNIYASSMPLSETPFTLFVFLSIYFLLKGLIKVDKNKFFVYAGVSLALALLTRPIGVFLPYVYLFILIVWMYKKNKRIAFKSGLIFFFITYLTIAPWSLYNYIKTNKVILLASHGVASIKDGHKLYHKSYREKQEIPKDVRFVVDDFYKNRNRLNTLPEIVSFIKEKFKEDKLAVINFYIYKAKRVWYGLDSQNSKKERVIKIVGLFYIILFLISIYFLLRRNIREEKILLSIILLITIVFWGMATIVVPLLRYVLISYGLFSLTIPLLFEKKIIKDE